MDLRERIWRAIPDDGTETNGDRIRQALGCEAVPLHNELLRMKHDGLIRAIFPGGMTLPSRVSRAV